MATDARTNEYVNATTKMLVAFGIQQALEHSLCRCTPLQQEIDKLKNEQAKAIEERTKDLVVEIQAIKSQERELDRRRQQLEYRVYEHKQEIQKVFEKQIDALTSKAEAFDDEDHPKAHGLADIARAYARLWVLEQVENHVELPRDGKELRELYAQAIVSGWTPRPTQKEVKA